MTKLYILFGCYPSASCQGDLVRVHFRPRKDRRGEACWVQGPVVFVVNFVGELICVFLFPPFHVQAMEEMDGLQHQASPGDKERNPQMTHKLPHPGS